MPEVPAVPHARLTGLVAAALAEDGPLATRYEGFETRPGQQRLAEAVATVFADGGTLVAEAGTGTGKTLAYLIPAILAGRRVLVSTGTRTLQDQVFYKDLPALASALGRDVRSAYMKGRTNYVCLHRLERLQEAEAGLPYDDRRWLERIGEWAAVTETGDRAEIDELPDDLPLWMDLTATSEQCLGRECPDYARCFVTRMRERAAAADIVIVNHHLMCADASVRQSEFGEVIPHCDLAVIDEAHQLEDIVTQYFGVSVSTFRVEDFARDATQAVAAVPAAQGRAAIRIATAIADMQQAARRLFDAARTEFEAQSGRGDRIALTADMAVRLENERGALDAALDRLADRLKESPAASEDLDALALRARALADDLQRIVTMSAVADVRFLERRGRNVSLRAVPIDASALIRAAIVGNRHATVLTSATLAVDESFEYALGRLGVAGAATLQLPSEFDFRTQTILYLTEALPDPRSPTFNAAAAVAIRDLLECTAGRAFVLFTSYSALRDVHARLSADSRWPLFVQGTAPRSSLLRDFRATPHAVLLATASFWQGVDVAGEALSCVIIDRLPFASPADPLVAARIGAIRERGGDPFGDYQVPLAIVTLRQGLGRLIRSRTDRGVLAVLDPRIHRMSYGRRFLASLPPAPITDDLQVVRRFLADEPELLDPGPA